ncbi:MAG: hypothetical protein ACT4QD_10535 [Acidobacteriota bacterium]
MRRWLLAMAAGIAFPVLVAADVLVLRDGSRVQGQLISVRNGVVEFEEQGRFGRGRQLRLDRADVVRIELESTPSYGFDGVDRRPPGMRERQVIVSADVAWNDAGVDVRAGQTVYFEAVGNVRWGRDRRDGPEGERDSPPNPGRPMPNRPAAALIGKVGNASNDFFFIGGEQGGIRVRSSGRLYLGVNDDFLADNSGNFRVVVYY